MSSYNIWLARWVGHELEQRGLVENPAHGTYVAPITLPLSPFVGLGVIVDYLCDPAEIVHVFVSEAGAMVCCLPSVFEDGLIVPWEEWPKHREFLTTGWGFLGNGPLSSTKLYALEPPSPRELFQSPMQISNRRRILQARKRKR